MLRDAVSQQLDNDPHFRWRGLSVTRIENLSDVVFALALGMLVSARSDMQTFGDLNSHLLNIFPVAAGFAIFLLIWNTHFVFYRRYGLADGMIVFLNACLLLVVLFLAYPLRFIFDSLFAFLLSLFGYPALIDSMDISFQASGMIMAYFAVAYAVLFLILSQMYRHALSQRDRLELTASERILTKRSIWSCRAQILCAVLAFVFALYTPLKGAAGSLLGLMWIFDALINRRFQIPEGKQVAKSD